MKLFKRTVVRKNQEPQIIDVDEMFYNEFTMSVPLYPVLPIRKQMPAVRVIMPIFDKLPLSNDAITLLITGVKLAKALNYNFQVIQSNQTDDNLSAESLQSYGIEIEPERYSNINIGQRASNRNYPIPVHKDDIFVCTTFYSANILARMQLTNKFIYLIQKYEPILFGESDARLIAEESYMTNNFIPLIKTSILLDFFQKNNFEYIKNNGISFEPAFPLCKYVEKSQKSDQNKEINLLLCGSSDVSENAFYRSILAINRALIDDRLDGYKINAYYSGTENTVDIKLDARVVMKKLEKMSTTEYYKFAQTIDVAITPMLAPHPGCSTFEFAKLGATVVTTKWQTKQNLDSISKNIIIANPIITDYADKIVEAILSDSAKRKANLENTHISDNWNECMDGAISQIIKQLQPNA